MFLGMIYTSKALAFPLKPVQWLTTPLLSSFCRIGYHSLHNDFGIDTRQEDVERVQLCSSLLAMRTS